LSKAKSIGFPDSFRFGVATADHQCEAYVPGSDDIRDEWERVRGQTPRGMATDFWNRFQGDIDLAKNLGCKAFRVSLSWARLEPNPDEWSASAFEHYRQLLQAIRDAGMISIVTLLHNTWPLHVQAADNGSGMLSPKFPDRFAQFARKVAVTLGDLIDYYISLNEPNQLIYGYLKPWWARSYAMPPGLDRFATASQQMNAVATLIPNLFLAHARARSAIQSVHATARVGTNPFVLGLPDWLQRFVDWNATRVRDRDDLVKQGRRVTERRFLETGAVDVTIAQITMTAGRMDDVMFSESYFVTKLAVLGHGPLPDVGSAATWAGRVGVIESTTAEQAAENYFQSATISLFPTVVSAVDALRNGVVGLVLGDESTLTPFASGDFSLKGLAKTGQPYAAAVAPGHRTLLNAIDIAIREFKERDASGSSPWSRSYAAAFPGEPLPEPPIAGRRATLADIGKPAGGESTAKARVKAADVPRLDKALDDVRGRGTLRVGVHAGVDGLCTKNADGTYSGIEPDLGRYIALRIFGPNAGTVTFVPLEVDRRMTATRSWLRVFDPLLRFYTVASSMLNTNWWYLGMAGRLAPFLCPQECVEALDFVGIDYYWGINAFGINRITHLMAAAEGRYANAPVWPNALYDTLRRHSQMFPNLPIIVVENGCVTAADGIDRGEYLIKHLSEVQRALADGMPIEAYLCWSITSNREWGLPFDQNSDFGLYYIDLDHDQSLTRVMTSAAKTYAWIIAGRSAEGHKTRLS
jgi:beta-glucosidase/6-phospho-beta-glucosidase/beta-galactosidase/ABC-type amino acid transport substrate-binding protein